MSALARLAATVCLVALAGCIYDAPITERATRAVDPALLGNWVSADGKTRLKVRRLDEGTAIVSIDGFLMRAWHSDLAGMPLVSLQDIDSGGGKYAYVAWRLADGGKRLLWRAVSQEVVPADVGDAAAARKLLERERNNPALLEKVQVYRRP